MKTPYLVQRGTIHHPMVPGRLSEAVNLDYMGSAEFEFGALPKSLRALQSGIDDIKITVSDEIKKDDRMIRVLSMFSPDEMNEYMKFLHQMRAGNLRLKEGSGFDDGRFDRGADFWWDIENHVMFSFDKNFMNRLGDHLVASWKYMDEQAKNRNKS